MTHLHQNLKSVMQYGLSNDQLRGIAPSIFAEQPWSGVSAKYQFIPTIQIVEQLRGIGLVPMSANQSRARIEGKQPFTKHQVKFRLPGDQVERMIQPGRHEFFKGPITPQIVITNSHDRSCVLEMVAGLFQLACYNGLLISVGEFENLKIRHAGSIKDNVIDVTYRIIEDFPQIGDKVQDWQTITLDPQRQEHFAEMALGLRWPENPPLNPRQLLMVRRAEDLAPTLWNTYQRVQENLMKGGIAGTNQSNRRMRTRGIHSVSADQKLNKGLWKLTEDFAAFSV